MIRPFQHEMIARVAHPPPHLSSFFIPRDHPVPTDSITVVLTIVDDAIHEAPPPPGLVAYTF